MYMHAHACPWICSTKFSTRNNPFQGGTLSPCYSHPLKYGNGIGPAYGGVPLLGSPLRNPLKTYGLWYKGTAPHTLRMMHCHFDFWSWPSTKEKIGFHFIHLGDHENTQRVESRKNSSFRLLLLFDQKLVEIQLVVEPPTWKICSSNWIISPQIRVKIKNIWVATT